MIWFYWPWGLLKFLRFFKEDLFFGLVYSIMLNTLQTKLLLVKINWLQDMSVENTLAICCLVLEVRLAL